MTAARAKGLTRRRGPKKPATKTAGVTRSHAAKVRQEAHGERSR